MKRIAETHKHEKESRDKRGKAQAKVFTSLAERLGNPAFLLFSSDVKRNSVPSMNHLQRICDSVFIPKDCPKQRSDWC